MTNELNTEKRMYCLVAYNLSDIQKGIQSAHAIAEYGSKFLLSGAEYIKGKSFLDKDYFKYKDWIDNWKTIIVLNGGTSNNYNTSKYYGTLQQHRDRLKELGVTLSQFHEPDLNDALTAVCFIVDMEKDWIVLKYLQDMKLA